MTNPKGVVRGWIEKRIADFLAASPTNTMQDETGEPAWECALVGFAAGADPIWQQYKEYVGPFHIATTRKLLTRLKYLEGILPVCASCKKIRDESGNWQYIESYIRERSAAEFSHGICPECAEKLYPDFNPYKKRKPQQR